MGSTSKISWTDASWSPVTGCSHTSDGCRFCFAERLSLRQGWSRKPWTVANAPENVILHDDRLTVPLRWKKPRKIFVCSMADLFHENVPDQFIGRVFWVMAEASWHQFQVLTKRSERLDEWSRSVMHYPKGDRAQRPVPGWPPNVWVGVSAEDQRSLDARIGHLQSVKAEVQFLSLEPLLGPIVIPPTWLYYKGTRQWVIVAGESGGPPDRALVRRSCFCGDFKEQHQVEGLRPSCSDGGCGCEKWRPVGFDADGIRHDWVADIRDQCVEARVPFHFKGWGGPTARSGGRLLDGREWLEFPSDLTAEVANAR